MDKFTFVGNWNFESQLPVLAQLKSNRFYKYETRRTHKEKLDGGLVTIRIYDEETDEPDPREEQIRCIDWIIANQSQIWRRLYISLNEKVFPYYLALWNDDPNDEYRYPKLNSIDNLPEAIGMDSIGIHFDHKDNISYYTMYFSFCTDEEHGLAVTLHRDRMINFGSIGDMDNRKVIEDLGLNYDDWLNDRLSRKEKKTVQLYSPHLKYGKLKPWQESANKYYPYGLLHADRDSDLINYLRDNPTVRNEELESLIQIAERNKKHDLLKELRQL